jgi:hypothetical protein
MKKIIGAVCAETPGNESSKDYVDIHDNLLMQQGGCNGKERVSTRDCI